MSTALGDTWLKRDILTVVIPNALVGEQTKRTYCKYSFGVHNWTSAIGRTISNLTHACKFMPDGSWNNDAINYIIVNYMRWKSERVPEDEYPKDDDGNIVISYEGFSEWIMNELDYVFHRTENGAEKKAYFKDKLDLCEQYIDSWVPDDDILMGFYAMVY